MKRILTLLTLFALTLPMFPQEEPKATTEKPDTNRIQEPKEEGLTEIQVGPDGFLKVIDNQDTVKVKVGKKGIKIVEGEAGNKVELYNIEEPENNEEATNEEDEKPSKKDKRFHGHWEGLELGLANYLNSSNTIGPAEGDEYMDLHTGKSWNVNLNFLEFNVSIIPRHMGLTTGMGLEFSDYRFDNPITLVKDKANDNVIIPFDYSVEFDPPIYPEKTKLSTTYLTAPLLLEFQIPTENRKHPVFLSGGVIGGVKVGSHTKVVYMENGSKQKDKVRDDFNLNTLRYGFTARIGYRSMGIFATYYPTPLFEKNKGPELYPFSLGLTFTH
jgi:hypothetical protein